MRLERLLSKALALSLGWNYRQLLYSVHCLGFQVGRGGGEERAGRRCAWGDDGATALPGEPRAHGRPPPHLRRSRRHRHVRPTLGLPLPLPQGQGHRVITAAFWREFNHECKISPGWQGWGVARPPLFITATITSKVALYVPAEWADLFHKYVLCGQWCKVLGIRAGSACFWASRIRIFLKYVMRAK